MTPKQKIELRMSEVRSRLSEIAGLEGDAFTDEIRSELDGLKTEFRTLESRHQAAIMAEGEVEARMRGQFGNGDGEAAEVRQLLNTVTLADYLTPASAGAGIEGRAREVNAALKVDMQGKSGGVAVPWAVLEARAFTTTTQNDGSNVQRPILQRLFGPGVMDALGVRIDSVPVGRSEWPLITGGVAPDQAKETTAAGAAVAATFSYANLTPKRLTGKYEWSHEAAAVSVDLEAALRRDLGDAVMSKMSDIIINGTASNAQNPQRIQGFIARLGAATDLSNAEATAADYGGLHALAVDGIHASMETEVMGIIGDESYQHAAGVYIQGSGESGSELLKRRSAGCMASTYIPSKSNANKQSAILHAAGPNGGAMRGDSVAALWPTLEVIRDIYTQASQGVVLTWVALWDAHTAFRSAAYKHIAINIG